MSSRWPPAAGEEPTEFYQRAMQAKERTYTRRPIAYGQCPVHRAALKRWATERRAIGERPEDL